MRMRILVDTHRWLASATWWTTGERSFEVNLSFLLGMERP